jgi:hypothetical protein
VGGEEGGGGDEATADIEGGRAHRAVSAF